MHHETHFVQEMSSCSGRFTNRNLSSIVLHFTIYLYNVILILHKKYPVISAN
jgi:hypothetical protein